MARRSSKTDPATSTSRTGYNMPPPKDGKSLPYLFEQKRKRKVRKHTKVIAWHRHLCNGGLHGVGLTNKGQLVFSHHTIVELKRACLLQEFGNSCACADVYKYWVLGENKGIHHILSRERLVWNRYVTEHGHNPLTKAKECREKIVRPTDAVVLAYKLMQKRRAKRDPDAYQTCRLPDTRKERVYRNGAYETVEKQGFGEEAADVMASRVAEVLQSWGLSGLRAGNQCVRVSDRGAEADKSGTLLTQLYPRWTKNYSSVEVRLVTRHTDSSCSVTIAESASWPLRYVCDMTEFKLFFHMIEKHQDACRLKAVRELEARAVRVMAEVARTKVKIAYEGGSATFGVSCEVKGLTAQAAYLIAKVIDEVSDRSVKSIASASEIRLRAEMRTPAVPGTAVGVRSGLTNPKDRLA